jgi:hypothetical protein
LKKLSTFYSASCGNKPKLIHNFDWKRFDLDRWENEANALLANYASWKSYCDGFAGQDIPESTFALARYFQLQAERASDDTWAPSVVVTPVADRTRSKMTLERRLFHTHLETPTKSTGLLAGDSESEEEFEDVDESPVVSESPAPLEIRNMMYQQTKDEQIVNTALVNFFERTYTPFRVAESMVPASKVLQSPLRTCLIRGPYRWIP